MSSVCFSPFKLLKSTNISLDRKTLQFEGAQGDVYPNVTLLRNGYLGASPLSPSVAISIRTLVAYHQTHRVCPHLSIEAEVRKLCHLHRVRFVSVACSHAEGSANPICRHPIGGTLVTNFPSLMMSI